jgi:hypothetical protein
MAFSRYYPGTFLEDVRIITKNLRITNDPAEIRMEYLPNARPGYYIWTNMFGVCCGMWIAVVCIS